MRSISSPASDDCYFLHTFEPIQLEELNMENGRLVNPELDRLRGVVDSLKAEVIYTVFPSSR